jgi:nucleoid-associated protein YgaU
MFGRNLERSMERLGIPPAAVAISEPEPAPLDEFVMDPVGSSPTEAGEVNAPEPKAPVAEVPSATPTLATWTIRPGDTLSEIAAEVLGSSSMVQAIIDLNPGVDPMRLKVGAELQLPPREAAVAGEAMVEPDFPDDVVTHVVREGETLSEIAKAYFGSSGKWELIWNANRDRMAGPDRLSVGTTLLIPLAD